MLFSLGLAAQNKTIYDFVVKDIDGKDFPLAKLKGKKVMIVNTASQCGYTPQFKDLQKLYDQEKEHNFTIIAFPANNFMGQEPKNNLEIKDFCTANFGVTFPIMAKISVKGDDIAPLYEYLTNKEENGVNGDAIRWNFEKFLIDEQGHVYKVLAPAHNPLDPEVIAWIEED